MYYSRAVCEENLAKDIISGLLTVEEDGCIVKADKKNDDNEDTVVKNSDLPDYVVKAIVDNLVAASDDYQIYADKIQDDSEKEEIKNKLEELNKLTESYVK